MIIKRYIVNNMNEAMTRIRYELGKDAVIISQRKIRKPGLKGIFSKKMLEVTAAVENVKKNDEVAAGNVQVAPKTADNEIIKKAQASNNEENTQPAFNAQNSDQLLKEMQDMKNLISEMMNKAPEKGQRRSKLQIRLEECDLNEKLVKKIAAKVKTIESDMDEIKKSKVAIEKMISISKVKTDGTVVFVGPTGVGKTTTIAKLAGRLSLLEKKKVGLITIDTYRIGAVEQLKTYADIMNIPFKVVFTMKEMEAAVEAMKNCDVVLIDTTGRSCKNTMQISELRAFVEKANTDNVHLVMSSTTKNKDIASIIEGYRVLNFNNVIITKLDETSVYGSILNILDAAKKPLSFITTGQNVPDDIKMVSASEVSSLILGEDNIC